MFVFFKCFLVDNDIVQVWDCALVSKVMDGLFHVALKAGWGIHQAKWNPILLIEPPWCDKRCLQSIFFLNEPLVVGSSLVQHH